MAETNIPDFEGMWRDMVSQWERGANDFANQAMKTAEFSRAMNQTNVGLATMQKTFAEIMSRFLAGLNLPSRTDLTEISQRLQAIERGLERLSGVLPGDDGKAITTFKPARTRQPRQAIQAMEDKP